MDEARRRAEAVADEVTRWQSRQHIVEILLVYAADATAQAVKDKDDPQAEEIRRLIAERNMLRTPENFTEALVADHMREQAEAIARLTTELAGAEATNAVLDEEVARLRAEIKRWKDTLEMELTHSQAWVAQAVRAERERAIGLIEVMIRKRNVVGYDICDFCGGKEFRWPEHHPECEHGQLLEALRREPTQ